MSSVMAPTEPKGYTSLHAAAKFSGVSARTIRRLQDRGVIPAYHLGRRRLVNLDDLDGVIRGSADRPSDPAAISPLFSRRVES